MTASIQSMLKVYITHKPLPQKGFIFFGISAKKLEAEPLDGIETLAVKFQEILIEIKVALSHNQRSHEAPKKC